MFLTWFFLKYQQEKKFRSNFSENRWFLNALKSFILLTGLLFIKLTFLTTLSATVHYFPMLTDLASFTSSTAGFNLPMLTDLASFTKDTAGSTFPVLTNFIAFTINTAAPLSVVLTNLTAFTFNTARFNLLVFTQTRAATFYTVMFTFTMSTILLVELPYFHFV